MCCSLLVYNFWWQTIIGYYRRRNYERSLDFAIQKEKEWQLIKPKEEEEEEEDYGAEVPAAETAEATPAEGGSDGADEEWNLQAYLKQFTYSL